MMPVSAEALIPDNRVLPMLVRCYQHCREHFQILTNARMRADLAVLHQELRRRFLLSLQVPRERPFELAEISSLRSDINSRSGSEEESLVRIAALLRALSKHVARELLEPIIVEQTWVSVRPRSLILERLNRLPRLDDEVTESLDRYHPELHLTPITVGDKRLVHCRLPRGTAELFRARLESNSLKIAMSPLSSDAELELRLSAGFPPDQPAPFLVASVGPEKTEIAVLGRLLDFCREGGISILVLPELRMPPYLFTVLEDFLRRQAWPDLLAGKGLPLVVAGSWHLQDSGDWVNRSVVLDHRGEQIWTHDKLARYEITAQNVLESPWLKTGFGLNDHGGVEAIRIGDTLQFCDSPAGRLAVAICSGFFHAPLEDLLKASGATVFLVPAMTPDVRRIAGTARRLVESQRAATFVANSGTHDDRSFYLLPAANSEPKPADSPPAIHVFDLSEV